MKKLLSIVLVLSVTSINIVLSQRIEMQTKFATVFEALGESFDINNTWAFFDSAGTVGSTFHSPWFSAIEERDSLLEIIDFNEKFVYRTYIDDDGVKFEQKVPMLEMLIDGDIKTCYIEWTNPFNGNKVPCIISINFSELNKFDRYDGEVFILTIYNHDDGVGITGTYQNIPCFSKINQSGYGNITVRN